MTERMQASSGTEPLPIGEQPPPADGKDQIWHKIVVIGDSYVGKTCLLYRYSIGKYLRVHAEHNVLIANKTVNVNGRDVKLRLWDLSKVKELSESTRAYLHDASAVIMIYDITERSSFESVKQWTKWLSEQLQDDVVRMILGNKTDLDYTRVVSEQRGANFAKHNGMLHMDVSILKMINVSRAFAMLAAALLERRNLQ